MNNLVSIITLVRDKSELTKQYVEAIIRNTHVPYELIIVDNASTDDTISFLRSVSLKPNKGVLIRNNKNVSFSKGNNQAVEKSTGNILCFVNNDTIPKSGWLEPIIEDLQEEHIGIVGAKLITPGRGTIQHAGVDFNEDGHPLHVFFGKNQLHKKANIRKTVPAVTGACLAMRKDVFNEVGGFCEDYFYGYEDIDLCNKVRERGYSVLYEPKSELYHYESMTEGRYEKDTENRKIYLSKWAKDYGYANKPKDGNMA